MGLITKGMGAILKHAKKAKVKKAKLKTVHKIKPDLYIKQFKKSKKHSLGEKFGVWSNRAAGKTITQAASGITVKFKKSGMPYIPKGEKPSKLTKAKGWAKITAPGLTAVGVEKYHKGKKK